MFTILKNKAGKILENLIRFAVTIAADECQNTNLKVSLDIKQLWTHLNSPGNKALANEYFTWNHRFVALLEEQNKRAAAERADFIDAHLENSLFAADQMRVIEANRERIVQSGGLITEFGVYQGGTTRNLARIFSGRPIHAFDSFEGLPENWAHAGKGTFGEIAGQVPVLPNNVFVHKGWFEDTLPIWFEENKDQNISLLRIDCDIYSSTKTIFTVLKPLIKKGTWVVFDELIGYRGWKHHEYKALQEFLAETGFEYEYVAFGLTYVMGYLK